MDPSPNRAERPRDDLVARDILSLIEGRAGLGASAYALLGIPPDADMPAVRRAAREALLSLRMLAERPLSPTQRLQTERIVARIEQALHRLGEPSRRAAYDARLGNFRGVARCLAAGLTATHTDELRRAHLALDPRAEATAVVHRATARAYESQRNPQGALASYERALSADPLNLSLHQAYWSLARNRR